MGTLQRGGIGRSFMATAMTASLNALAFGKGALQYAGDAVLKRKAESKKCRGVPNPRKLLDPLIRLRMRRTHGMTNWQNHQWLKAGGKESEIEKFKALPHWKAVSRA